MMGIQTGVGGSSVVKQLNLLARRDVPRVPVNSLCSEHSDDSCRHSLILDLSEHGLRMQRPLGGPRTRSLQLEFEIPEVDEIVWARGEIVFDQVWRVPDAGPDGLSGVLRTSGVRIVAAATRHQRMLREYVADTYQRLQQESMWMYRATCYLRG